MLIKRQVANLLDSLLGDHGVRHLRGHDSHYEAFELRIRAIIDALYGKYSESLSKIPVYQDSYAEAAEILGSVNLHD
jgi:hypothetical protein